jgi:hypothetical protein
MRFDLIGSLDVPWCNDERECWKLGPKSLEDLTENRLLRLKWKKRVVERCAKLRARVVGCGETGDLVDRNQLRRRLLEIERLGRAGAARARQLPAIDIRWRNNVTAVTRHDDHARVTIATPDGPDADVW